MKFLFAWALALMLAPLSCPAQVVDERRLFIEDLRCRGNVSTSCPVILGYLHLAAGDRVDEEEIQSAKLRLSSLPGFIAADIHLEKGSEKGRAVVVVEVLEADRADNEFVSGTSSRLSSLSQTFEGRLTGHHVFGTEDTANLDVEGVLPLGGFTRRGIYSRLQFVAPKLLDSSRYFLISGVSFQDSLAEYPNADSYKVYQLGIDSSVGRRIFNYSYVTVGYLYAPISRSVSHWRSRNGVFLTDTHPTNKGLSFGYGWDSEDDPYFPSRGSRFSSSFGSSWATVRYRKTWRVGTDSVLTLNLGGTPGSQYRSSLDETQQISVVYAHSISTSDRLGGIRQGRWYVEPGYGGYGVSAAGDNLAEVGLKAGIRLESQALGMVDLYVMGSTSAPGRGRR